MENETRGYIVIFSFLSLAASGVSWLFGHGQLKVLFLGLFVGLQLLAILFPVKGKE